MTADERTELNELRRLKCWQSVRLVELERKAHVESVDAWRKQDVFGDQAPPFEAAS